MADEDRPAGGMGDQLTASTTRVSILARFYSGDIYILVCWERMRIPCMCDQENKKQ